MKLLIIRRLLVLTIIAGLLSPVQAGTVTPPKVLLLDGYHLARAKERYKQGDAVTVRAVDSLEAWADALLNKRPVSVMDKASTPPSGNKHDYMSRAPYFWYDSTKPNGLPYVSRDGQRNPEIYKITDRLFIGDLERDSRLLALAWYFTGKEKYAAKAAVLLRHWFLDDSTRMNPNLNFAQAVPGVNDGRGIGIIETIALTGIADAALLLEGSRSWTGADAGALRSWYTQYLGWMQESKNGRDEHATKNNHGTWYLTQATDFALFTGDTIRAKAFAEEGRERIESQIDKEGKMALELERTNALWYSTYHLQALFGLATLSEKTGVDLWNYHNKDGAGIRTALDWLSPYALGKKTWGYQQISPYNRYDFYELLLRAARAYHYPRYTDPDESFDPRWDSQPLTVLVYARDPKF